jgi:hypothetical protein
VRTRTWILTLTAGLLLCLSAAAPASACPMCKLANESDNRLPRAYMYSILFMLGMPASVLGGFSFSFWRLSRKAARLRDEAERVVLGASDPAVQARQAPESSVAAAPETLPGSSVGSPGFLFR